MCGPYGADLIGAPETVAAKVLDANAALGGLSRLTFQMSSAMQEPDAMERSITLLGTEVMPRVRAEIAKTV